MKNFTKVVIALALALCAPVSQPASAGTCNFSTVSYCGEGGYGCECINGTFYESCFDSPPYSCGNCWVDGDCHG